MENNNIDKKENKEPMTTKQKVFFGLRIAFNVVFYTLIIFLFLFSIMNIRGGNVSENFPNIFGRGFLSVQSDSMERDEKKTIYAEWKDYEIGGFTTGDLLNVKTFDEKDVDKLKIGDVITFQWTINGQQALNTHRIVNIYKDSANKTVIVTQGDKKAQSIKYNPNASATELYIQESQGVFEVVSPEIIKGIVTSVNSGAGKTLDTIQKNWLFIFVIPIIVLLVIEVFLVVRNIMILRGEKNKLELADSKEAMMNEVEAEREKMRQELLAELRAQGLAPQEEAKEEPKVEETVATEEAKDESSEEVKLDSDQEETQVEEQPTESTDEVEETKVEEKNDSEVEETTEEVKEETKPQEEVENKEE